MTNWSWTSSDVSVEQLEEEEADEEDKSSNSSVSFKTVSYLMKKIIDSRKVYQDLMDTGYFSHVVR